MSAIGQPVSIEVSYSDPALIVGFTVFDDSGSSPVQVGSTILALNFYGTSYRAKFTPPDNKPYLINKAVYTDDTLATIDTNYSQGSQVVQTDSTGTTDTPLAFTGILMIENQNDILAVGSD